MLKRYLNLDFIRFFSAIIIIVFHLLHYNLPDVFKNALTISIESTNKTYIFVEIFLMIAGFFLYKSSKKTSIGKYCISRFLRIYPTFLFYNLVIITLNTYFLRHFFDNILLLSCTPLSSFCTGIIWFVVPFFWASILLFCIIKIFPKINTYIILTILILCYSIMIHYSSGYFNYFNNVFSHINFALLRVIGGLCVGIMIGNFENNIKQIKLPKILLNLTEISCCFLMFIHSFVRPIFSNDIYCIMIFAVLFIILIINKSFLSRLINTPTLAKLGKYTYSIYIMQQVSFDILNKHQIIILNSPILTIISYTIITIIIGIITYYITEYPILKIYKQLNK